MDKAHVDTPTSSVEQPKSARISLTANGSQLTLFAIRKAGNTAATFAVTTDLATKKAARGMTQKHATFEAATGAIAKQAVQAEKLGWLRKAAGRRFVQK